MKPEFAKGSEQNFVIVDLPLRLTKSDVVRLNAAVGNAVAAPPPAHPIIGPGARVSAALDRAIALVDLSKRRENEFGADLFGEPAWDILLDLFIQRVEGRKASATSVSIASRAPTTTALRYIAMLISRGLASKRIAEHDLRVHYIELSDDGYRTMIELLNT